MLASTVWECVRTILFRNLKSRIKCECLLRSLSDGQFNVRSISVILSLWFLLLGLFNTNLAAWCCIIFLACGWMFAVMDPM